MSNNNSNNNGRRLEVPNAQQAMDKMKNEIAEELGLHNYATMDKGMLPSRVNGYVGGNMVRKMVREYQNALVNGGNLTASTDVTTQDQPSLAQDAQSVQNAIQKTNNAMGGNLQ